MQTPDFSHRLIWLDRHAVLTTGLGLHQSSRAAPVEPSRTNPVEPLAGWHYKGASPLYKQRSGWQQKEGVAGIRRASCRCRQPTITETNRMQLVLFGMQNRTSCPYLAAINRILISLTTAAVGWPPSNRIHLVLFGMQNRTYVPIWQPSTGSSFHLWTVVRQLCCRLGQRQTFRHGRHSSTAWTKSSACGVRPSDSSVDDSSSCWYTLESQENARRRGFAALILALVSRQLSTVCLSVCLSIQSSTVAALLPQDCEQRPLLVPWRSGFCQSMTTVLPHKCARKRHSNTSPMPSQFLQNGTEFAFQSCDSRPKKHWQDRRTQQRLKSA
jgi:hypothetical protein